MPSFDTGTDEFLRNAMMLSQIMQQRKMQQAQQGFELAKSGETWEEAGLNERQFKRLFGRAPKPGEVLKEPTLQETIDRIGKDRIDTATPEELLIIGSSALSRNLGVNQIVTPGALATQGQTSEIAANTGKIKATTDQQVATATQDATVRGETAKAQAVALTNETLLDTIMKGQQYWAKITPELQQQIGGQLMGIPDPNSLLLESAKQQLASEAVKEALRFVTDPQNHALGRTIGKLGIDPVAAIAASGNGMMGLIDLVGQLSMRVSSTNAETESALQKVMAAWAGKFAESLGGIASPEDVLIAWDKRRNGKAPNLNSPVEAAIAAGSDMAFRAFAQDAFNKGNPEIAVVQKLLEAAKTITDPGALKAMGELIRQSGADALTWQTAGPKPNIPGPQQEYWINLQKQLMPIVPGFEVSGKGLLPKAWDALFGGGGIKGTTGPAGEVKPPTAQRAPNPGEAGMQGAVQSATPAPGSGNLQQLLQGRPGAPPPTDSEKQALMQLLQALGLPTGVGPGGG